MKNFIIKVLFFNRKEITIDDISDGISIISDSESAGRQTPLYDLEEHPSICENIIKASKHQYSSREDYDESEADNEDEYEKDENEYDVTDNENNEMNCSNLQRTVGNVYSVHNRFIKCKSDLQVDHKQSHPLSVNTTDSFLSPQLQGQLIKYVKSSLKGVLYMTIITLVVAVFVGKFRQLISQIGNPDQGLTSVDGLQQRVDEMELKNNLMRAEIDLLNKQVKYLTSVNSLNSKHYHHNRHHDKQKEAFKAWSGLGDTIEQVYIKKDDLKKPFLCDDGRYVEVAAMCLDKQQLQEKAETFVDELSNTMDSILKEPRRSESQDHAGTMPEMTSNKEFSRPIDEYLYSENISPDYWSTHASNKDSRVGRGERGTKRFDKEYGEFSESKERIDKRREKKQEKRSKKMKKEKENRKRNEDKLSSREYRDKEKYDSKEKIRDNFDWHQDYMQNRADARNSKHYDSKDNWYLERSKNREYQRYEAGGMNINGGDK